uniref:MGC16075 protein n=1 Tax=Homo sapiens TaxID=9606 RepID=Q96IP2_HUMAN|nr:MGC16075 protein [Homo sapiens]AAS07565.1 unknown [Homo sapiens]EAL23805.1 hypothetical protein MGC16075 [Homo sapiens]
MQRPYDSRTCIGSSHSRGPLSWAPCGPIAGSRQALSFEVPPCNYDPEKWIQ